MGTQQIILVVLAFVLLGISVAVGLQLFTTYHKANVQQMSILDMKAIAQMVIEWWKTSTSNGGGRFKNPITSSDLADIYAFISLDKNDAGHFKTENGAYALSVTGQQEITIEATTQYPDVAPVLIVSLVDNTQDLQ